MNDRVSDFESYWSDHAWKRLADLFGLTEMEIAIVRHLLDGKSDKEIAQVQGISKWTVHTHLGNLYRKTGVSSRGELVALALRHLINSNGP